MSKQREYPKKPDRHLITDKDTIKQFSVHKQKSMNFLALLFQQGIPAVYLMWTRAKLMLAINIIMYRQWQKEQLQEGKKNNVLSYSEYALRTLDRARKTASQLQQGARLSALKVAKLSKGTHDPPVFMPVDLYLSSLTAEGIAEIQSHAEPHYKANLEALQKFKPSNHGTLEGRTEQSTSDKIRQELKQVEPEMREKLLNDLLSEQEEEEKCKHDHCIDCTESICAGCEHLQPANPDIPEV
jgi:hypothetical protein